MSADDPHPDFLAITGPTASGKTALSLAVAERLDGEIVSMDSRQVYRGMDIGTAKVSPAERARVPHHGLDLVDPDARYSAGRFARDARAWIAEIRDRGRTPILVGGTGFFLRALLEPLFSEPPLDAHRRDALRAWLAEQPVGRLSTWAARLDPVRSALATEGGRQRLSRTLEVALLTGRPLSEWHRRSPPGHAAMSAVVIRLELPREELDRRIQARTAAMVRGGLVAEVRALLARGYGPAAHGMTGTGYREIAAYLAGEMNLEEAEKAVAANTRRYARRQLTWLRNQLPEDTCSVDATAPLETQLSRVLEAWAGGAALGQGTGTTTSEETA